MYLYKLIYFSSVLLYILQFKSLFFFLNLGLLRLSVDVNIVYYDKTSTKFTLYLFTGLCLYLLLRIWILIRTTEESSTYLMHLYLLYFVEYALERP